MSDPFIWLLARDDVEGLRRWLDAGGSLESQERLLSLTATPAEFAAYYGCLQCLRLLAERGAKLDCALALAVHSRQYDAVTYLQDKGVQPAGIPSPRDTFVPLRLALWSLAELDLSVRATNCLETLGITTVGELCQYTALELLHIRGFGETSLREVLDKLAENRVGLREE